MSLRTSGANWIAPCGLFLHLGRTGERVALRGLLVEFAWRSARQVPALAHQRQTGMCAFRGDASVFDFFANHGRDPRHMFLEWLPSFFSDLAHSHPPSKAERIAQVVREKYQHTLRPFALAHRVQMRESQLRRAFRGEFGMSIREYCERVRILASLQRLDLEDSKLEAIAQQVGYKSKKNFYRAFKKRIRMTPADFRRCPPEQREQIIDVTTAALRSRTKIA